MDFYTNNPLRNVGFFTTHDPTITQGGGTLYSQTLTETFSIMDYVSTSEIVIKGLTEGLHISDFISTSLSGGQYYGILKRWSGAIWVNEPLKTYLSGWQTKPLKRWNGTNWVEINIGG
jgi:hypothetical protein